VTFFSPEEVNARYLDGRSDELPVSQRTNIGIAIV
jgi:hypothetical protein